MDNSHDSNEPVAWVLSNSRGIVFSSKYPMQKWKEQAEQMASQHSGKVSVTPLYTSPPTSKPWVGLTKEDRYKAIRPLYCDDATAALAACHSNDEYEAIEAKLKDKNEY